MENDIRNKILSVFQDGGKLSSSIMGFEPRCQQQQMVEAILDASEQTKDLVVEAGTGTGKTFAYLIPNMMMSKQIIVSTGTKNLQDQLMERDVPLINSIFRERKYKVVCLKGRSNYLCLFRYYKIKKALDSNYSLFRNISVDQLRAVFNKIEKFDKTNSYGDLSQFTSDDEEIVSKFRCNSSGCPGSKCKYFESCNFRKFRELAKDADLTIVNHSLYMSDYVVEKKHEVNIIPKSAVVIFDEAHKLPDFARNAFSKTISSSILKNLLGEMEFFTAGHVTPTDEKQGTLPIDADTKIKKKCKHLNSAIKNIKNINQEFSKKMFDMLVLAFPRAHSENKVNTSLRDIFSEPNLSRELHSYYSNLKKHVDVISAINEDYDLDDVSEEGDFDLESIINNLKDVIFDFKDILEHQKNKENQKKFLAVLEVTKLNDKYSYKLSQSMLDFSDMFYENILSKLNQAIFTSATLTVNNSFKNFISQLGIREEETLFKKSGSPFNYQIQGRLYIPINGLPLKSDFDKVRAFKVAELVKPLLNIIDGGFFILCTNTSVMNQVYEILSKFIGNTRAVYLQGKYSKLEIMANVQEKRNSVVVATSSFWEGVDVKGKALSCVVIDRLPFPAVGDPLIQALCEVEEEKKKSSSFMQVLYPHMMIALKQGVGRLIRSFSDYGVVLIADERMNGNQGYIRSIYNDLPNYGTITDTYEVYEFWEHVKNRFN